MSKNSILKFSYPSSERGQIKHRNYQAIKMDTTVSKYRAHANGEKQKVAKTAEALLLQARETFTHLERRV